MVELITVKESTEDGWGKEEWKEAEQEQHCVEIMQRERGGANTVGCLHRDFWGARSGLKGGQW